MRWMSIHSATCMICVYFALVINVRATTMSPITVNITELSICPIVPIQNRITIATSIGGALGTLSSICVLLVIFAHKKENSNLRERIVAGLSAANCIYSILCLFPLWYREEAPDCGYITPIHTIVSMRMSWFAAKYVVASYEIFILAASIYLLKQNKSTLARRPELASHVACWTIGFVVLVPSLVYVNHISTRDENRGDSGQQTFNGKFANGADGDLPSVIDTVRDLNSFVIIITQVWICLFLVAVGMWVWLRFGVFRSVLSDLQQKQQDTENFFSTVNRHKTKNRLKLLELERTGYLEVVKPLEPYVLVFLVFLPPIVVLALPFCNSHTNNFHTCQAPCEMVLAYRAFGSSLVYFANKECRDQLYDVPELFRRLIKRLCCCCGTPSVRFDIDESDNRNTGSEAAKSALIVDDQPADIANSSSHQKEPPAFNRGGSFHDDDEVVYDMDDIGKHQEYHLMDVNA
eukprot:m.173072 g.173072  ORF g.173072 m.173072 type:complete len:463 (+) comp31715_c1_seq1:150-1538(+)